MCVLFRPPGLGDNCWNASRHRFELTHNPRPLNLVQLVANYFDTGTLNKTSGCINNFVAHSILTTAA
ncbi:hypothetical protein FIV27_15165 [Lactiplantibacillus plantarum]|nr:hypothetical protein [Lactiplantibacillus plantarum]